MHSKKKQAGKLNGLALWATPAVALVAYLTLWPTPADPVACYARLLDDLADAVAAGDPRLPVDARRALHLQRIVDEVRRTAGQ